ncbi:MAG: hypothetical protein IPP07_19230 [Holophagales bacterium]|jgi:hypothetical protein|nr:hypothetical protein [Holophagales bacterium]
MSIGKKHLFTGALLAFVAVTAVTIGVKETRHARAVAAIEATRVAEPPAPSVASASVHTNEPTAVAMAVVAPPPTEPAATVVVTYFRATARCTSCLKIEDLTNATMTSRFAVPIAEKRVVWRVLNLDEPENSHFVKDYGLFTKSVVVSEVKNGKEVRWKNLDQIWQLLGDPAAFQGYVEKEVQAFRPKA